MTNRWYVSINFNEDIQKYQKFLKRLMNENSHIYVRKDYLDFNQLIIEDKEEIIEGIYEAIIYDVQYFKSEENKIQIYNDILCKLEKNDVFKNHSIKEIKKLLKKEEVLDIKQIIKQIIMKNINIFEHEEPIFIPRNKFVFQGYNNSFRSYFSGGTLEDFYDTFDWYKVDDLSLLLDYLKHNLTYDYIITNDIIDLENFNFYISCIENVEFVLAICGKNKKYEQEAIVAFEEEFGENNKLILYDKSDDLK